MEDRNPEIRPSIHVLLKCADGETTRDNGRTHKLGGLTFSTRHAPMSTAGTLLRYQDGNRERSPRESARPRVPQNSNAEAERRASRLWYQAQLPGSLPRKPEPRELFMGMSCHPRETSPTPDIEDYTILDRLGDVQEHTQFTACSPVHAAVLDTAMTARNFADIGRAMGKTGKTAERQGKRSLQEAVQALKIFRQ